MADATVTVELTEEERQAVIGWAGMAGVGFSYGPTPVDPNDPSLTALKKIQDAQ